MTLQHRQSKIQEKRKQTPWRDFVMEIASWSPYNLYKRDNTITVYKDKGRVQSIVKSKEYNKNRDTYEKYGIDYYVDGDFFKQLTHLLSTTPLPSITEFKENEASDYSHIVAGVKNSYLSFTITSGSENVLYSSFVKGNSINIFNSLSVTQHSENIYNSLGVNQSTDIFYSKFIDNCNNIWFSDNLIGCHDCILCSGLSNQSYCINNAQYTKDEYIVLRKSILSQKMNFDNNYLGIKTQGANINSQNVEGEAIYYSQNINKSRFVSYVNGGGNNYLVGGNEPLSEVYDTFGSASRTTNHCYAGVAHGSGDHHYCNYNSAFGSNIYYSWHCENCSYLLGCVGLRNKQFYILNKQYSKEERHTKVDEIFAQMDADGSLGEFFPASMNPFYFNDTAAYLIDPSFTKEEVTERGYLRRDEPVKVDIPEGVDVVKVSELGEYEGWRQTPPASSHLPLSGETVWWIDPAILTKIIVDEEGNYYKIVKMEYDFLLKYGLPLPRKHRLERMKENFHIG